MICILGRFVFELVDMEAVEKKIKANYAKYERLGNYPARFAVGKYEESFEMTAIFYNKKRDFLDQFEEMIKDKKPIWLVFPSGEAYRVVIESANLIKSYFTAEGVPIKQEIKLSLEVYYE